MTDQLKQLSEAIYARDLDGTGSMHICSKEDPGAVEFIPASEARAREAVAYEVAANICHTEITAREAQADDAYGSMERARRDGMKHEAAFLEAEIRALTPDHTTTALERIKANAGKAGFERGIREAAKICRKHTYQPPNTFLNHCALRKDHREDIETAILATLSADTQENSYDPQAEIR